MADYTAIKYNVPYSKAGSLKLITTFTSDGSDATATFSSGIDSTYKEYLFIFNNIHPETDAEAFTVNFRDGSTAYDATKTSTWFQTYHGENGASGSMGYEASYDLAQSTSAQQLIYQLGNGNDECCSGYLHLFNPSSTTYVKHFFGRCSSYYYNDAMHTGDYAGYCNVTAAIDGVQFAMSSGEIQGGTIQMFGVE
jgi:hypothetical protein